MGRQAQSAGRPAVPHTDEVYGYSPDFVHPKGYLLSIYGCGSKSTDGSKLQSFSWRIDHAGTAAMEQVGTCEPRFLIPEEGKYDVTLRTVSARGRVYALKAAIDVQDIVILSFGDSSASGEGNPSGRVGGRWVDNRCHRSTTSGHALAAEALEAASRQSTVTFLSFACSGADIKNGILGPYEGQDPKKQIYPGAPELSWQEQDLVSQVQAAKEALCSVPLDDCTAAEMRKPDLILLAIGVNDLGFTDILTVCADLDLSLTDLLILPITILRHLASGSCDESTELNALLKNASLSIDTQYEEILADVIPCDLSDAEWRERLGFVPIDQPGFCYDVNNTYGEIRRRLIQAGIYPSNGVYLTTYPADIFSKAGTTQRGCGIFSAVNTDEARWLRDWGQTLNELLEVDAVRNGFFSVPGIVQRFRNHGYCAGPFDLIDAPGDPSQKVVGADSYYVALTESLVNQLNIDGTVHPNRRGHEAIRDAILDAIHRAKPPRAADREARLAIRRIRYDDLPTPYRYRSDLRVWLQPNEPLGYNDVAPSSRLEKVLWKSDRAEVEEIELRNGQWVDLPEPIRLKTRLSPSDTTLRLSIRTRLRTDGPVAAALKKPPPDFNIGDEVLPADNGVLNYFAGTIDGQRTATPAYGAHPTIARLVTKKVGNQAGFLTIEYCLSTNPIGPGMFGSQAVAVCPGPFQ